MNRFETRLARTVSAIVGLALLPGCSSEPTENKPNDTGASFCLDWEPPDNRTYYTTEAWMIIPLGADCPPPEDATLSIHECTPTDEWTGVTCEWLRVERNQWLDSGYYGGKFRNATEDDPKRVDVCYYDGIFWDNPVNKSTCGRPVLRDGEAMVAPVTDRHDWVGAEKPVVVGLSPAERAAVAAYWLDCAKLEHASVASFNHFTLDLMRLGAPPDLLHEAHQAGLDEIKHAQQCFSLASAYAGRVLGPGPLELAATPQHDSTAIAEALFREGCIGETLAVVDASARLAVAKDRVVRNVLTDIVKDEARHAALAWRALEWILQQDQDGAIRAHLQTVFMEEETRCLGMEGGPDLPAQVLAHGLVDERTRARAFRRGWEEVVAPSWHALAGLE